MSSPTLDISLQTLLGVSSLLVVLPYLVCVYRLADRIRKDKPDYWRELGSPTLWTARGQGVLLPRILGFVRMPADFSHRHDKELILVRMLLVIGLGLFVSLLVTIQRTG
ncbi:MAG TPA: hypothetical protein VM469_13920 [Pseudoxanthomonas sp.]|jgi:hypothetical protein|nr:hypothetical protein [Pseudoxanthomonas sp.]